MTTEVIIHAHAGGQEIFDRHVPLWKAHELPIVVICPEDSVVSTDLPLLKFGKAGPLGPVAYHRWMGALKRMVTVNFDRFLIFEYDAFCLSKEIPESTGLTGVVHPANGLQWVAQEYAAPPWAIDRTSASKMLAVARLNPGLTELGYVDRLYSALAQLGNVPITAWTPQGFCMNTIGEEDIPALQSCIRMGGRMIHGVKTQKVLDACLEAMG